MKTQIFPKNVSAAITLFTTLVVAFFFLASPGLLTAAENKLIRDQEIHLYFNNAYFNYNDGDLRSLDESSFSTVENTDDAIAIGYMELGFLYQAKLLSSIDFFVDAYRVGYWGNDSIEFGSEHNTFYVRKAYFDAPVGPLTISAGRMRYSLSANPNHRCYSFNDTIDALVLGAEFGNLGVDLIADLFSMNAPADSVYALRAGRHEYTVDYFDGDVNIYRFGVVPSFKTRQIAAKPFLFFSRVGATGYGDTESGGYEMTDAGTSGNYADNDWLLLSGAAFNFDARPISLFAELTYSTGKDRKGNTLPDVSFNGFMIHLSGEFRTRQFYAGLSYMYASGGSINSDGNVENYGYVGMKGNKIGGFLFTDYYGVYPSAILSDQGIDYFPVAAAKRSPMSGLQFKAGITGIANLHAAFDFWLYYDTSSNNTDYSQSLPADRKDYKRLGNFMGYEMNVKLGYRIHKDILEIGAKYGFFVPYDFFLYPVSDINAPYGMSTFTGLEIYSELKF